MVLRRFCIALLAIALSGCWVLDELSEGSKKMDRYTKAKPGAEESSDAPAAAPGGKRQRLNDYFASQKNPKTFTSGTVSEEITRCKLKGDTQFMKKDECISRGGVPAG
jgi:hypothetical protein